MKHLHLQIYAERYAELRQALGFKFRERGLVQQFVDFLESQNCSGPIRTAMVLEWAVSASPSCGRCGQVRRLTVARHFLICLKAFLPDTEIPAPGLLAEERRPRPYLYSSEEIVRMQQATRTLWEPGCLKQFTFETLIGLLASTGLRIGEALRLAVGDLHLDFDPPHLEIRNTKFGKSRFVPVHPSTAQNLRLYLGKRCSLVGDKPETLFLYGRRNTCSIHQRGSTFGGSPMRPAFGRIRRAAAGRRGIRCGTPSLSGACVKSSSD